MIRKTYRNIVLSNRTKMETIAESNGYQVKFNGSKTYMVIDSANQCRLATPSKRKAINLMNKIVSWTNPQ